MTASPSPSDHASVSDNPFVLAEALGFTAEDLAANREGRLSATQRARLQSAWRRSAGVYGVLMIGGILLATILLFAARRTDSPVLNIVGIGVTFINAAVVGLFAQSWLRFRGDTDGRPLQVLTGPATRTLNINPRARMAAYFVTVGGARIRVNKPIFNAFTEHAVYRVYRAPLSHQLLTAEQIDA